MVRLKLIKGRSYTGEVRATRERPFVEVDEAIVDGLISSGYFRVVDSVAEEPKIEAETPKAINGSADDTKAVEGAQDDEKKVSDDTVKKDAPAGGKAATKTGTKKTAKK